MVMETIQMSFYIYIKLFMTCIWLQKTIALQKYIQYLQKIIPRLFINYLFLVKLFLNITLSSLIIKCR